MLTALQTLHVGGRYDDSTADFNRLQHVPAEICLLKSLKDLNLSRNMLGTVPTGIGALTALQKLRLHFNQLAEVPKSIGSLTALKELRLNNNNLTSVPAELGSLRALQQLNLQHNQLESLPATVGLLTELKWLSVASNKLQSVPAELALLPTLQLELDLQDNPQLLTPLPAAFENLQRCIIDPTQHELRIALHIPSNRVQIAHYSAGTKMPTRKSHATRKMFEAGFRIGPAARTFKADETSTVLSYENVSSDDGIQTSDQWCGWQAKFHRTTRFRVSAWLKFADTVPPPSANFGIKLHGAVHNKWLSDCVADKWCFVNAEGPSTNNDESMILLIFDTMGGPRRVQVKDLQCEVLTPQGGWDYDKSAKGRLDYRGKGGFDYDDRGKVRSDGRSKGGFDGRCGGDRDGGGRWERGGKGGGFNRRKAKGADRPLTVLERRAMAQDDDADCGKRSFYRRDDRDKGCKGGKGGKGGKGNKGSSSGNRSSSYCGDGRGKGGGDRWERGGKGGGDRFGGDRRHDRDGFDRRDGRGDRGSSWR
jgi:hypothetical protein